MCFQRRCSKLSTRGFSRKRRRTWRSKSSKSTAPALRKTSSYSAKTTCVVPTKFDGPWPCAFALLIVFCIIESSLTGIAWSRFSDDPGLSANIASSARAHSLRVVSASTSASHCARASSASSSSSPPAPAPSPLPVLSERLRFAVTRRFFVCFAASFSARSTHAAYAVGERSSNVRRMASHGADSPWTFARLSQSVKRSRSLSMRDRESAIFRARFCSAVAHTFGGFSNPAARWNRERMRRQSPWNVLQRTRFACSRNSRSLPDTCSIRRSLISCAELLVKLRATISSPGTPC
mmetsp:Transcript_18576/g.60559  ORF Transcript_18576/g.60559 Transcript_18576/m.60559 type:complete len:293 (+) Transcript_18576:763-1641(+)